MALLLLELLLTAALTLLAAFLLATLFAANDPGHAAAPAIAEEEEERIIEVDEVKKRREGSAAVSEPEGWVEVDKAPAAAVVEEEDEPGCSPQPDEKAARGAGPEEEEAGVAEAPAPATEAVVEATQPHVSIPEAVPREVPDVVALEGARVPDAEAKRRDLGADAAPTTEHLSARPEKTQGAEEVTEALPTKLQTEQRPLVYEAGPAAEVLDAGMGENVHAIQVRHNESAPQAAAEEIPDVVSEKKEERTIEAKGNGTAEAVPQAAAPDVPLPEKEVLKVQQPVEEAAQEEVQSKEETTKSEPPPADQQQELVPQEKVPATETGDVVVSHEGGGSNNKVATELPVEAVTLQEPPKDDDAEADMDFEEWEGIERSEVEKRFGAAAAFAASEAGAAALSKLNSDVQLQLEGLLKVVVDGPCYDSAQPLTLRPSTRAKWVAWQKLGNMHPEIAMEKYMNLLSEVIPGWLGNETSDTKEDESGDYSMGTLSMAVTSDQQSHQGDKGTTGIDEGHLTASPNPEKGQSSNIPAE